MASQQLNPHERPPKSIMDAFKFYRKMSKYELDASPDILDLSFECGSDQSYTTTKIHTVSSAAIDAACFQLADENDNDSFLSHEDVQVFEIKHLPGK